jgi:exopolyphosphatase / guanosine-5'-triphosphate,3'-diphosphate pyrophosphatase
MHRIAVIDIGSNTIKLLVARRNGSRLEILLEAIEECRMSGGISQQYPELSEGAIQRGTDAVYRLVLLAREQGCQDVLIVATSAVRDAVNGRCFVNAITAKTGFAVRVINGIEEARWVAEGVRQDPAFPKAHTFIHFDLGGGSLEFNRMVQGKLRQSGSMQLGAVRLTEIFVPDPSLPMSSFQRNAIETHVGNTMAHHQVPIPDSDALIVVSGGSAAICRALLHGMPVTSKSLGSPILTRSDLESLFASYAVVPLDQRLESRYLPRNRADILGTAIVILLQILKHCKQDRCFHTLFALRHGIAAGSLLNQSPLS